MTAQAVSARCLTEARYYVAIWRGRCAALEGLTAGEREEVAPAVVLASLKFSTYHCATRLTRSMAVVLLTLPFYALT